MNESEIESVLAGLSPHECGWHGTLPKTAGLFLGQSIGIDFETRPVPKKSAAPKPNDAELALARLILAKLPQLLNEAKSQFEAYEDNREVLNVITAPHIWINRDTLEDEPDQWTFVIGRSDHDDFGYHIEFDGCECVDIWAGD